MADMDQEFKDWILEKAKNMKPEEMVKDDWFCMKLLNDVAGGRSTRFNKSSDCDKRKYDSLTLLRIEYEIHIKTLENEQQGGES